MAYDISTPEQWLALYGDTLYRYALTRVRDACTAEDLVQETLLGALKSQAGYAGLASESTRTLIKLMNISTRRVVGKSICLSGPNRKRPWSRNNLCKPYRNALITYRLEWRKYLFFVK